MNTFKLISYPFTVTCIFLLWLLCFIILTTFLDNASGNKRLAMLWLNIIFIGFTPFVILFCHHLMQSFEICKNNFFAFHS